MTIQVEVTNNECKIIPQLSVDQLRLIQEECQFKVIGAEFKAMAFRNKSRGQCEWDGYRRLFNIQTRRFPIGLLPRVIELLNKYGIQVEIINHRKIISIDIEYYHYAGDFMRDYQHQSVVASLLNGNGIIKVATGGGKTVIAGCTIGELKKRTIFIVHTKDLLYQAKESFERLFVCKIGQIGDGIIEYENITVATMQSLAILGNIKQESNSYDEDGDNNEEKLTEQQIKQANFREYANTVQCVMMDEVQIVSSITAFSVRFLFEYANHAFGYSASPWRDDGSDLMIEAAFGKRIVDINASYLIQRGYLVKPTIELHTTTYDIHNQPKKYVEVYKKFIVENDMRNIQVASDAVNEYRNGNNVLVLVTQVTHGKILQEIMHELDEHVTFISGKSSTKKRKQAIEDMRNGTLQILIATTIADVGLDIPRLNVIVEAGAGKSSVTALQRLGRIMRPFKGKDSCRFITYKDNVKFLMDHWKEKVRIWRTEPEFIIIDK